CLLCCRRRRILQYFRCFRRQSLSVRQDFPICKRRLSSGFLCVFNIRQNRQILFRRTDPVPSAHQYTHRCKRSSTRGFSFFSLHFFCISFPESCISSLTLLQSGVSCAGVFFSSLTISPSINVMILSA